MVEKRKWQDEEESQLANRKKQRLTMRSIHYEYFQFLYDSNCESLVKVYRSTDVDDKNLFDAILDREECSLDDWMKSNNPIVDGKLNVEGFVKPLQTLMECISAVATKYKGNIYLSKQFVAVFKHEGEFKIKIMAALGDGKRKGYTKWNMFIINIVNGWFGKYKSKIIDQDLLMFLRLLGNFHVFYDSEGSIELLNRHPLFFQARERKRRLDMSKKIHYLMDLKKQSGATTVIVDEFKNLKKAMQPEYKWFSYAVNQLRRHGFITDNEFYKHPVMRSLYNDNGVRVHSLIKTLRNLACHVHEKFQVDADSVSECAGFVDKVFPGVFSVVYHVMMRQKLAKFIVGDETYFF